MLVLTGATGFVGRTTCAVLAQAAMPFRKVGRHPAPGQIAVGEIGPDTDWRHALDGAATVIHLAARVHHMRERDADPQRAYRRTNVEGTLNLARQAHRAGVKRFVFVSSVKVNGEHTQPGHPFRAADDPAPCDPYGQSKLEAERGLWTLSAETGLAVVVVRPPLVYGANVGANFRALVSLVRRNWPLPFGGIDNKRSLIAVENLADLLLRCATHPQAPGETFLCSDGQDLSTPDLVRAIGRSLGCAPRLFQVPPWTLRSAAALTGKRAALARLTESLQVDATDTRRKLGWTPPLTLDDALTKAAAGWVQALPR